MAEVFDVNKNRLPQAYFDRLESAYDLVKVILETSEERLTFVER